MRSATTCAPDEKRPPTSCARSPAAGRTRAGLLGWHGPTTPSAIGSAVRERGSRIRERVAAHALLRAEDRGGAALAGERAC